MAYNDDDLLLLSGLQHFSFCRRQWALIHIEQQWAENFRTTDGEIKHKNAHDAELRESRGDLLITRGMNIRSARLGVTGACDVVEFRRDPNGVTLAGREGKWLPFPVEYKHGADTDLTADRLQLCAQAMCLEEMLLCDVPEGALFYEGSHRRTAVVFTPELRAQVEADLKEMHELYRRGYTPKVKPTKVCNACSLKELCLPKLLRVKPVRDYLKQAMEEL